MFGKTDVKRLKRLYVAFIALTFGLMSAHTWLIPSKPEEHARGESARSVPPNRLVICIEGN